MGIVSEAAKHLPTFEEQVESARQYRQEIVGEYLRSVWHDVGEDVGDNSLILVLDEEGRGCTTTREQLVRGYGEWGKGFCRWAYVEDLMPDIKED